MDENFQRLENYEDHFDKIFICVQFQFDIDESFKAIDVVRHIRSENLDVSVYKDDNDKSYLNFNFYCEDLSIKWEKLKHFLFPKNDFGDWAKKVTIITCPREGDWYEYLLLWSFDNENEELDQV